MDFMELARTRRSIREYSGQDIPAEALEQCVEAARHAPSACNAQPWKFIIVTDPGKRAAIAKAVSPGRLQLNKFASRARAFIVIVSGNTCLPAGLGGLFRNTDFRQIDAGIACGHVVMAAWDLGIGSCILGWFDERTIKKLLNVPAAKRVHLVIALGYPASKNTDGKQMKDASLTVGRDSY